MKTNYEDIKKFTLNAICSRKCATPLLASVSNRDPVSIHSPTVAVGDPASSVATLMPLSSTVTRVGGTFNRVCSYVAEATAPYHLAGCEKIIYFIHYTHYVQSQDVKKFIIYSTLYSLYSIIDCEKII